MTDHGSSPIEACPCCGRSASRAAFAVRDRNRLTSAQQFHYRRCSSCDSLWLADPPVDLGAHYPADYHAFPSGRELEEAALSEQPRLAMLARHVPDGRLVEIGPSLGSFSYAAKRAGFDVTALERDADCCRHLSGELGVEAIHTTDPAEVLATLAPVRAVAMWHVIEHVPAPGALLEVIADRLEPGGVLGVATPNPLALQARLFGRRWVHIDAPRHLTLMPFHALREAAARAGLQLSEATTVDPLGRQLSEMGWQRSLVSAPALAPGPKRFAWTFAQLGRLLGPVERRGLRGAAVTAVFAKPER